MREIEPERKLVNFMAYCHYLATRAGKLAEVERYATKAEHEGLGFENFTIL